MTDPKTPEGTAGGLSRKRREALERRESTKRQAAQASLRRRNAAAPSAARSEVAIPEGARPMLWRIAVLRTAEEARRLRAAAPNKKAKREK
jgi:hypothetical protein